MNKQIKHKKCLTTRTNGRKLSKREHERDGTIVEDNQKKWFENRMECTRPCDPINWFDLLEMGKNTAAYDYYDNYVCFRLNCFASLWCTMRTIYSWCCWSMVVVWLIHIQTASLFCLAGEPVSKNSILCHLQSLSCHRRLRSSVQTASVATIFVCLSCARSLVLRCVRFCSPFLYSVCFFLYISLVYLCYCCFVHFFFLFHFYRHLVRSLFIFCCWFYVVDRLYNTINLGQIWPTRGNEETTPIVKKVLLNIYDHCMQINVVCASIFFFLVWHTKKKCLFFIVVVVWTIS